MRRMKEDKGEVEAKERIVNYLYTRVSCIVCLLFVACTHPRSSPSNARRLRNSHVARKVQNK